MYPSIFNCCVFAIISISSKKQMSRIYAAAIIAFMKHLKSIWNLSIRQLPHEPVNPNSVFISWRIHLSVSRTIGSSGPQPATRVTFCDSWPKLFCDPVKHLVCRVFS